MYSNTWIDFYHRLASPKNFYQLSKPVVPVLAGSFVLLFVIGAYLGLLIAPTDYQQGDGYRILYVHVPAAWMSLFVYTVMALAAVVGFVWRIKTAFMVCICSAPIGAAFTLLALLSGSIWGKPMWGTWWVWDARLTSELILLFLYGGVMVLYAAYHNPKVGEKAAAILSIIGVVNVPIIHYSVVWWNSLHQGSTVLRPEGPAMSSSMLIPLLLMAASFMAFYGWVLILRMRNHILQNSRHRPWAHTLFEGAQS